MGQSDKRIGDGNAVEEMLKSRGWALIAEALTNLRAEAHQNLLINEDPKWRHRLQAFDEALGISDEFLKDKDIAEKEKKENGQDDAGIISDGEGDSREASS